jgi:hypothetical protein
VTGLLVVLTLPMHRVDAQELPPPAVSAVPLTGTVHLPVPAAEGAPGGH